MDNPIFDLTYHSWDSDRHLYFQGPPNTTLEDFEDVCDKLLPYAGYAAALKSINGHIGNGSNLWITWTNVVEALIPLLTRQGYQLFTPPQYEFGPSGAIGLGDYHNGMDKKLGFANKLIRSYNHELDQVLKKQREAMRKVVQRKIKNMPQIMK